jgi:hypothetical protein
MAKRLYAALRSNHVRCWFAPEDLKWGDTIRTGIDEAIRLHDKLLLILSKSSVASWWVEREVKTVLAKERKEKRTVLFPVRVDKAVFESPFDWATEIRHERNIGDFTRWKNHDDYEKAFSHLLRDLKAEAMTGYGCIDPSGMVAPLSDLAVDSCSVVTLASVRLASSNSAPIRLASLRRALRRLAPIRLASLRLAPRKSAISRLAPSRSAPCRSALRSLATHYSCTFNLSSNNR